MSDDSRVLSKPSGAGPIIFGTFAVVGVLSIVIVGSAQSTAIGWSHLFQVIGLTTFCLGLFGLVRISLDPSHAKGLGALGPIALVLSSGTLLGHTWSAMLGLSLLGCAAFFVSKSAESAGTDTQDS